MPGLLNANEQPPQGGPAAGGAPPVGAPPPSAPPPKAASFPDADDKGNVSKEEQAQYDEFVTNAMTLMNDEKGVDKLLKAVEGDGNPVEGLANVVASIVMRVEDSAEKGGTKLSGDVLIHGGTEILEQAADLAEQAGGHAFTDDELESATYMALDLYRDSRKGKIDQGAFQADLEELKAAEADGSLEEQIPGITEHSQKPGRTESVEGVAPPAGAPPTGEPPAGEPQQRGLLG